MVKSFEKRGLPNAYYCTFQYKDASLCKQDPLCGYEAAIDTCNLREPTLDETGPVTEVHSILYMTHHWIDDDVQDVLPFIQKALDRDIVRESLACRQTTNHEKCSGNTAVPEGCRLKTVSGACKWIAKEKECRIRPDWILKRIAESDTSGEDALCTYISVIAQSTCLNRERYHGCIEQSSCVWSPQHNGMQSMLLARLAFVL